MKNHLSLRPESPWALNFARKDLKYAGEICDMRKKAHYDANLWRSNAWVLPEEARCGLEEQLTSAGTMEDKLGLFLTPEFLPYLKGLDLGESMNPANGSDLRKVEEEYETLRQKLIDQGVIEGELSRSDSGRAIHIDDKLPGGALLCTRNRSLFRFTQHDIDILVHKQTSFLISPSTLEQMSAEMGFEHAYSDGNNLYLNPDVVEAVEAAIDSHDPCVYPVRTHFFVKAG